MAQRRIKDPFSDVASSKSDKQSSDDQQYSSCIDQKTSSEHKETSDQKNSTDQHVYSDKHISSGQHNSYDQQNSSDEYNVDDQSESINWLAMAEQMKKGTRVHRGKDWGQGYGNEDGGPGAIGTVLGPYCWFGHSGFLTVRWDNGVTGHYRMGWQDIYDLQIA